MYARKQTKRLFVRDLPIGGQADIVVQSMNNTDTRDVNATLRQIDALVQAGCQLTRVAIPDQAAAEALSKIVRRSPIPVVADIHFSSDLALAALRSGADALRINPGNMRSQDGLRAIAREAAKRQVPIRVGINSGSLEPEIRDRLGGVNARSMCASALKSCELLEQVDFSDICISVKTSDPRLTIETYRLLSERTNYPLHLGVTEAGTPREGIIRSAVGIGTLLAEGIGDTFRVSLTADPVLEVETAYSILKSLGLRARGPQLISCPTCGRTEVDLQKLAEQVEELLRAISEPLKVAVMGCVVNGPGEAREADCGIAGGKNSYLIFRAGEIVKKVSQEESLAALRAEIELARKRYRAAQEKSITEK